MYHNHRNAPIFCLRGNAERAVAARAARKKTIELGIWYAVHVRKYLLPKIITTRGGEASVYFLIIGMVYDDGVHVALVKTPVLVYFIDPNRVPSIRLLGFWFPN